MTKAKKLSDDSMKKVAGGFHGFDPEEKAAAGPTYVWSGFVSSLSSLFGDYSRAGKKSNDVSNDVSNDE